MWMLYQSKNGCFMQGNDLTDCLWLGICWLRPTSISQNILLRDLIGWLWSILCVSMVLCLVLDSPEPWLGPVVCTKILSSCSYPPGQWCNCEHGWILGFSFSPSLWLVLFLLPWEEQVQHCHHVSYTNKQYSCSYCWCVVKPFIAALVIYKWRLGAMGAPYNGWVWMCCGLAMAGACAKHRPCYWSQTPSFSRQTSAQSETAPPLH